MRALASAPWPSKTAKMIADVLAHDLGAVVGLLGVELAFVERGGVVAFHGKIQDQMVRRGSRKKPKAISLIWENLEIWLCLASARRNPCLLLKEVLRFFEEGGLLGVGVFVATVGEGLQVPFLESVQAWSGPRRKASRAGRRHCGRGLRAGLCREGERFFRMACRPEL